MHPADEIARFLDGETRLIAAAHRADATAGLFVLPDGSAAQNRGMTKTDLRCFFPDCPSPDLTTVARRRGRDGFRHLTRGAGGHAPESFHHMQGKAVVAAWLEQAYPNAIVIAESATDSQRSRVADVMLIAGGVRFAFEIQYASLSPDHWLARHQSYVDAGVTDVWLWGHTGQLKKSRRQGALGDYRMTPTQEALRDAGLQVIWINPGIEQIGIATNWRGAGSQSFEIAAVDREFDLSLEYLRDVRVERTRLTSPGLSSLSRNRARLDELLAEQETQRRQRLAEKEERLARRRAEFMERARSVQPATPAPPAPGSQLEKLLRRMDARKSSDQPEVQSSPTAPTHPCRACGKELDTESMRTGYHLACNPLWNLSERLRL